MKLQYILSLMLAGITPSLVYAAINSNPNDVANSVAAYNLVITVNAPTISIPGAEATSIEPGTVTSGSVSNLLAQNIDPTSNYRVSFVAQNGLIGRLVPLNATQNNPATTVRGLGLYQGGTGTDVGGVLVSLQLRQGDANLTPISITQDAIPGACSINNNTLEFFGGVQPGATCTVDLTGSQLASVDGVNGNAAGTVYYTIAASADAGAGQNYSNKLDYAIAQIPS